MISQAETIPATAALGPTTANMYFSGSSTFLVANVGYENAISGACLSRSQFNTGTPQHATPYQYYACYVAGGSPSGHLVNAGCTAGTLQNVNNLPSCGPASNAYSCPTGQNWTVVAATCYRPDCVAPAVRKLSDGTCSTSCRSTATIGLKSYYDIGLSAGGSPSPIIACISGCYASWTGDSPVASILVAGVRHYLARGQYMGMGDGESCTVGANGAVAAGTGTTAAPSNTCPSGQFPQTINGVTKCYSTAPGNAPAPETLAVATETVKKTSVVNADNSTTITTTTTNNTTNNSVISTQTYLPGVAVPVAPDTIIQPSSIVGADGLPNSISGDTTVSGLATNYYPSDYVRSSDMKAIEDALKEAPPSVTNAAELTPPPDSDYVDSASSFAVLRSWSVPGHSSVCPTSSFNALGQSFTIDSHCALITNHWGALQAAMAVVWTCLALFIVLRA
jgi:hypothetical protein